MKTGTMLNCEHCPRFFIAGLKENLALGLGIFLLIYRKNW